jgi:hypothetical protein
MTLRTISEYFEGDDLMAYYDPTSSVLNRDEAIAEIYHKLIDHSKERKCHFVRDEIGYLFFSKGLLISFCVKKESRDRENLAYFGNLIKSKLGEHFNCYLFNINKKAIGFLERLGMRKVDSNEVITLLSI